MRRAALLTAALLALTAVPAAASRTVVIAFVGGTGPAQQQTSLTGLGLLAPSQISYEAQQAMLDLTQGAWIPPGDYGGPKLEQLTLDPHTRTISGWQTAIERADSAHSQIEPGLLASEVPGGAAFVAATADTADAIAAADRGGTISAVALGPDVAALAQQQTKQLVVTALPDDAALNTLLAARTPDELIIAVAQPPRGAGGPILLPVGATTPRSGLLSSSSTRRAGLVTMPDLSATVLSWLRIPRPQQFSGQPIHTTSAPRGSRAPNDLYARTKVLQSRRMPTVYAFLLVWLALVLAAGAIADRRGVRLGLRLGGLCVLWAPTTTLIAGALRPARVAEGAIIIGGGLLLGLISDRALPWPRAPIAPAVAMALLYTIDLARGSPWIAQSLLGFNPLLAARFYGIGNELEASLPIVLFAGVAAAMPRNAGGRRDAALFAAIGFAFTAIVASGSLGADVGALFTIGGGTAAGTVLLAPGGASKRNIAIAVAVPFAGLVALALLDLATGAGGHYTDSVLHAHSMSARVDVFRRKLDGAWHELRGGLMPLTTAAALAAGAYAIRFRDRVLAPVQGSRAWLACLGGGYAGAIAGSLTNDSGPQLLMIGTFTLACVTAYLQGGRAERP